MKIKAKKMKSKIAAHEIPLKISYELYVIFMISTYAQEEPYSHFKNYCNYCIF